MGMCMQPKSLQPPLKYDDLNTGSFGSSTQDVITSSPTPGATIIPMPPTPTQHSPHGAQLSLKWAVHAYGSGLLLMSHVELSPHRKHKEVKITQKRTNNVFKQ